MRHRAALAGALAVGAWALTAGPGPAATVRILISPDAGCCSVSNGSSLQNDTAGNAKGESLTVLQRSNGQRIPSAGEQPSGAGDSLGTGAIARNDSGELDDNSLDAMSSVTAPEISVLTRLLMVFADLSTTVFGRP
jgi:hypothetical protein